MPISLPPGRVNTSLATRLIISATRRDPIRAVSLRGLIYRAYWIEGRNISSSQVLHEVVVLCCLVAPDLILMNVIPNQGCGFEVCRDLKSDEYKQLIPILLLTRNYTEADEIKDLDYGASDLLCQSVSYIRLL